MLSQVMRSWRVERSEGERGSHWFGSGEALMAEGMSLLRGVLEVMLRCFVLPCQKQETFS